MRFAGLFNKGRKDRELRDELESHIQMHTEDNLRSGMTPEEARLQAMIKLGGIESTKEAYREQRGLPWLETLLRDVRFGARQLRMHPGFAAVAVLTLALGIGANTAIFSVVNAVLLQPLRFREPERLVRLFDSVPARGIERIPVALANFLDWRAQSTTLQSLSAYAYTDFNLTGQGEPRRLIALRTTANLLPLLGFSPQLGRQFTAEDEQPGQPRVVLLGSALWKRSFGGDPAVVGRVIQLDGEGYTVVGVVPPDLGDPYGELDVWTPAVFRAEETTDRNSHGWEVVGRLKPGVTLKQASIDLNLIAKRLGDQIESQKGMGVHIAGLQQQAIGNSGRQLWVLLGSVGCVLLIACANIANLQLASAAGRSREFAVRAALGASRAQVIRQLLTESSTLAFLGGGLGILLGWWGVSTFVTSRPWNLPRLNEVSLSMPALGFSLALILVTGIVFGLAPAWQAARADVAETLKSGSRSSSEGFRLNRLRMGLVVAEVALSLTLLVGAGLLLRSFAKLNGVDVGFQPVGLLTADLAAPERKYPGEARKTLLITRCLESVRSLPGVESASSVYCLPLGNVGCRVSFTIEGRATTSGNEDNGAKYNEVAPGYFHTMSTPLQTGRDFDAHDTANAVRVAIVNEAFARVFFPELAQGSLPRQRINLDDGTNNWTQVVGITRNERQSRDLAEKTEPEIFVPITQHCSGSTTLVVRTAGSPSTLTEVLRKAVLGIDPDLPIGGIRTMSAVVGERLSSRRFGGTLMGGFSILALGLAALGIYGVMAYSVTRRIREIGIRMALGAQKGDVLQMVVKQGMTLVLIGLAIGLGVSFGLSRLLESLLYEVSTRDAAVFGIVTAVLLVVAFLSCWLPARRAARVDPIVALRSE
jgi:putative ABC transport system permease protein